MKIIDIPKQVSRKVYEDAISDMVKQLSKLDAVHSVYQIGSVSHLGISDIDMLVVFHDDAKCHIDVRKSFGANSYLFTHSLYGCSESHWKELQDYTFFHNYRILYGKGFSELSSSLHDHQIVKLQRQIAIEFLVKNYYTLSIQRKYKMVKARSFLLEGKALIYDMEFLGIHQGELWDLINRIIELRSNWFTLKDSKKEMLDCFQPLPDLIKELLIKEFQHEPLFLPIIEEVALSKNVRLVNHPVVTLKSQGVVPLTLGFLKERKRFNALHRLNKFELMLPYEKPTLGDVNNRRFDFLSKVKSYNSRFLPNFLIPATSLKIS